MRRSSQSPATNTLTATHSGTACPLVLTNCLSRRCALMATIPALQTPKRCCIYFECCYPLSHSHCLACFDCSSPQGRTGRRFLHDFYCNQGLPTSVKSIFLLAAFALSPTVASAKFAPPPPLSLGGFVCRYHWPVWFTTDVPLTAEASKVGCDKVEIEWRATSL